MYKLISIVLDEHNFAEYLIVRSSSYIIRIKREPVLKKPVQLQMFQRNVYETLASPYFGIGLHNGEWCP